MNLPSLTHRIAEAAPFLGVGRAARPRPMRALAFRILAGLGFLGLAGCYDDGPTYVHGGGTGGGAGFPALPAPSGLRAVPLDGSVWLSWGDQLRSRQGFAHYRVYMEDANGVVRWIGDTDTPGFLDGLAGNGFTVGYTVRGVDTLGQEGTAAPWVFATPRPDFFGEWLYAWQDVPGRSGFRFPNDDQTDPILPGDHPNRDFRLEVDADGWWLVPGPGVQLQGEPVATTALRCGPAADAGCVDIPVAPTTGYIQGDLELIPGYSYVLRMPSGQGPWHYGVIRVTHLGFAQQGALALFDWAFQLQPGNPALSPPVPEAPAPSVSQSPS
jgi:hypothetical protein